VELTIERLSDPTARFIRWRVGRWIHVLDRQTGDGWWEWITPIRAHDYALLFPDPRGAGNGRNDG
jgi:hypothetical protein